MYLKLIQNIIQKIFKFDLNLNFDINAVYSSVRFILGIGGFDMSNPRFKLNQLLSVQLSDWL